MYDIDALISAHYDNAYQDECARADRYSEAVDEVCELIKPDYDRYERLSTLLEDGMDEDENDLTPEMAERYRYELVELMNDMETEANGHGVELDDCLEILSL